MSMQVITRTAAHATYPNSDRTTFPTLLGRQRMRFPEGSTPVSSADGQYTEFRNDDGSTDGGSNFFRCFNAQTNVTLGISNDDNCLESSTLTGTGLFLDRLNLKSQNRLISI